MSIGYDCIIVGSGLAGLTAAIVAHKQNHTVLLVEKEDRLGGNSAKATSGINLVNTPLQSSKNICDNSDLFLHDTIISSIGCLESDGSLSQGPKLCHRLAEYSDQARLFLEDLGNIWIDVVLCGGHSVARTHRASFGHKEHSKIRNTGWEITQSLIAYLKKHADTIHVVTSTKVIDLNCNMDAGGLVTGVTVHDMNSSKTTRYALSKGDGSRVILATGGFSANKDLIVSVTDTGTHAARGTTNGAFAQGDGLEIASRHGASLVDMNYIQLHPTGFTDPKNPSSDHKFLAPEALRGFGARLIDPNTGKRFVDELATRERVTDGILSLAGSNQTAIMVFTENCAKQFGKQLLGFYLSKGLIQTSESMTELASELVVPCVEGFDGYNDTVYYCFVTPVIHYTMGGLRINRAGQVLDTTGRPIPRLYAAGEVTGGLHGKNRLGGNSLLECVVFGMICAGGSTSQ